MDFELRMSGRHKRTRWLEWLLLATLLLLYGSAAHGASVQKSAAFDEQFHLGTGVSYLTSGDFRLANSHPPLAGTLAATAVISRPDLVVPLDSDAWQDGNRFLFSEEFLWRANDQAHALLTAGRLPIILLGLLLLLGIWGWGRQAWGLTAGWIALLVALFDPNLMANARLITTDLPLTAFFFVAMWSFWHWLKRPSWPSLLLVGVLAGLAMATKYTALLFWPVTLLCLLIFPASTRERWSRLAHFGGMGLVGLLVLWSVYRFDTGPIADFPLAMPVPAPYFWQNLWETFVKLPLEAEAKLDFLLGEVSTGGWWYYFPVALAVKTPLPSLALITFGGIILARHRRLRAEVCLWLPPLAFLGLGLTGVLTIGYRHILPALPFLLLLAGYGGHWLVQKASSRRPLSALLLAGLLVWLAVPAGRIYPHQEAYFNELAGDWTNWSNILVDSNLDWGQDLIALRQVMDDFGLAEVHLAYFGMAYPEHYGIRYQPLPGYLKFADGPEVAAFNPYTPAPGWYAISATSLRLGVLTPETADYYAAFRPMAPVGRAGYSIYLYHIPEDAYQGVNRIVVQQTPVGQLSADELGVQPTQQTVAKWVRSTTATLYPLGADFTAVYEPIGVDFAGVMTLLGVHLVETAVSPPATIDLTLYWQVGSQPMPAPAPAVGPPLSAFVHLTGEEVWQVLAQYDGWETALRGLEPGDVIAQPVTIAINDELEPGSNFLLVGLYSPQTMARLLPDSAVANEDFVDLTPFLHSIRR